MRPLFLQELEELRHNWKQSRKICDDKIYLLNDIKALLKANDKNIIEKLKTLKQRIPILKKT